MSDNRKKNIEIIQSNIRSMTDSDVNKIYQKVCDSLLPNVNELVTIRAKKIKYVENNLQLVDDATLNDARMVITVQAETEEEKMKRVALEICNKLLTALAKPEIDDLCNFKRISRKELMSDECKKIIMDNTDYVFKSGFKKGGFTAYVKTSKGSHVAFLRAILKNIGYDLRGKNGSLTDENGKKTQIFYSIVLNI